MLSILRCIVQIEISLQAQVEVSPQSPPQEVTMKALRMSAKERQRLEVVVDGRQSTDRRIPTSEAPLD
jgi:hypothetical protein